MLYCYFKNTVLLLCLGVCLFSVQNLKAADPPPIPVNVAENRKAGVGFGFLPGSDHDLRVVLQAPTPSEQSVGWKVSSSSISYSGSYMVDNQEITTPATTHSYRMYGFTEADQDHTALFSGTLSLGPGPGTDVPTFNLAVVQVDIDAGIDPMDETYEDQGSSGDVGLFIVKDNVQAITVKVKSTELGELKITSNRNIISKFDNPGVGDLSNEITFTANELTFINEVATKTVYIKQTDDLFAGNIEATFIPTKNAGSNYATIDKLVLRTDEMSLIYFIVSELSPTGTVLGSICVNGGSGSSQNYTLVSGNEMEKFSIDSLGNFSQIGILDYETISGYHLEVEMIDSITQEVQSKSVAVFVEDEAADGMLAMNQAGPYDQDQVINKLGGKDIDPTKFSELPLKLQMALNNSYRISTRGSEKYMILTGQGVVWTVRGPKYLSNPEVQWRIRLEKEEAKHKDYIYYEVFKLKDFFKELRNVSANISFQDSNGTPSYIASTNTIKVKLVDIPNNIDISTIIHETVHAIDKKNGWYLPAILSSQKAEALAWTTQHMIPKGRLNTFQNLENHFKSNNLSAGSMGAKWWTVTRGLNQLFTDDKITWNQGILGNTSRLVRKGDVSDVQKKLPLKFDISTLVQKYQEKINKKNINYQFKLDNITSGNLNSSTKYSVPEVFR